MRRGQVEMDVSVMRAEPNAIPSHAKHERMPVTVERKRPSSRQGCRERQKKALTLARSFDPAQMLIVQSGTEKKICSDEHTGWKMWLR